MRGAPRLAVPLVTGAIVAAGTYAALAGGQRGTPPASPVASDGRLVFARMGCASCHRLAVAGARGSVGPDLDSRLRSHTASSLRAKILEPYPGFAGTVSGMPEDYGRRMTRAELDALVGFLLDAGRSPSGASGGRSPIQ